MLFSGTAGGTRDSGTLFSKSDVGSDAVSFQSFHLKNRIRSPCPQEFWFSRRPLTYQNMKNPAEEWGKIDLVANYGAKDPVKIIKVTIPTRRLELIRNVRFDCENARRVSIARTTWLRWQTTTYNEFKPWVIPER